MKNNLDYMESALPKISEEDIYEAMKTISGYLDITPDDFALLYRAAFRHAIERIRTAVQAKDIMTRTVISVGPNTPLAQVASLMGKKHISGIPVTNENDEVLGMISEKDFLRNMGSQTSNFMEVVAACLGKGGWDAISVRKSLAKDIMTTPAITVKGNTPILEISRLFHEKGINRAPVISEENKLIGIVSRADLVKGYTI
ncbi:MAG: CBS domain-containing protein [Dissulfuribacterales bacterium]